MRLRRVTGAGARRGGATTRGVHATLARCLPLLVLAAGLGVVGAPAASAAGGLVTFSQSSVAASTEPGPYCASASFGPSFCGQVETVGDFNGDGRLDLAVANYTLDTVSVLWGTAAGNFGAATTYSVGAGPDALAVGDFNGDGRLDLAVANFTGGTVSVLLSTTTGSFAPQITNQTATVKNPTGLVAGDFNGDGRLDVVVSGLYAAATLLPGGGDGSFSPPTGAADSYQLWSSVAAGDFNRDGKLDVVVTSQFQKGLPRSFDGVSVLLGDGKGGFGAPTIYQMSVPYGCNCPDAVAVGDINGADGSLDLAVARFGPWPPDATSELGMLAGNGDGTFSISNIYDNFKQWDLTAVAIADLNGDGRNDVAVVGQKTGLTVWSDGHLNKFPAAYGHGLAVGDLNGDGRADLFLANKGSVTVMLNTFGPGRLAAVNDSYLALPDTPLSVSQPGVLGNDTEPNRKPLTASLVGAPAHGAVTLNSDGSFTYKAAAGYYGPDAFTYTVSNGTASSQPGTVSLRVHRRPSAANDSYFLNVNTVLKVGASGLMANDTNFSLFPRLTAKLVSPPAHGAVSVNPDGSFAYTPAADYYGPDAFTYTASDNLATSTVASVALTVRPIPVAVNDQYTGVQNKPLNVPKPGLLGNDLGSPGYTKVNAVRNASHGKVAISHTAECPSTTVLGCGQFSYIPAAGFAGVDSFTYKVTDLGGTSNVATVTLNITPKPTFAVASDPTNGQTILALQSTGTLLAKQGLTGGWVTEDTGVNSAAIASDPANGVTILALKGTTLLAKKGLTGGWVTEHTDVKSFAVASDSINGITILALLSTGTLLAKNGIAGDWITEYSGVSSASVASDSANGITILALLSTGTLLAKKGLTGGWVTDDTGVNSAAVASDPTNGITILALQGSTLLAKQGISGNWVTQLSGSGVHSVGAVASDPANGVTILALQGTTLLARKGLSGGWVTLASGVNSAAVASDPTHEPTILALQGTTLLAKQGIGGNWVTETTGV